MSDAPSQNTPAGWYEDSGSLRFWDGDKWTDQRAPVPPELPQPLTQRQIASSVLVGMLCAFFVLWLGAQISPEHVYLPIKFVVKELPSVYGR